MTYNLFLPPLHPYPVHRPCHEPVTLNDKYEWAKIVFVNPHMFLIDLLTNQKNKLFAWENEYFFFGNMTSRSWRNTRSFRLPVPSFPLSPLPPSLPSLLPFLQYIRINLPCHLIIFMNFHMVQMIYIRGFYLCGPDWNFTLSYRDSLVKNMDSVPGDKGTKAHVHDECWSFLWTKGMFQNCPLISA